MQLVLNCVCKQMAAYFYIRQYTIYTQVGTRHHHSHVNKLPQNSHCSMEAHMHPKTCNNIRIIITDISHTQ